MPEDIPSPFFNKEDKDNERLIDLLDYIFTSHGYDQWAFIAGKDNQDDTSDWTGNSNVISEGMVGAMKDSIEYMEKIIDEHEE
jgi:hypothetical protein